MFAWTVTRAVSEEFASTFRGNPPTASLWIASFSNSLSADVADGTTRRATQAAMFRRISIFRSALPVFTRNRSAEEK